ncbi:barstar family protein [Variovorax sp. VaC1]|uniref:barstar family protein n=1 Tax=Variovorax sp. VaC1 TaxID=3373132 RepID=UPI003749E9ED
MKHREFVIENNAIDSADTPYIVQRLDGLPTLRTDEEQREGAFLLTLRGLDDGLESSSLKENTVYSISQMIAGHCVDAAYIHCRKLVFKATSHQVYLVDVGRSDLLVLQILEAWSDGVVLNWRDLDVIYRDSWFRACRTLAGPDEWRQTPVTNSIVLAPEGLASEDDFYCYLGEQLFGHKGYAGTNLDAFYDVLKCNDLRGITIHIPNEERFAETLQSITGDADYFSKFKSCFTDAKIDLRLGGIHSS